LAKRPSSAPIQIADKPTPENLEGERKTVTLLFADIKGSMELIEDLDPEEARAIVDPALKLMMQAVQRYGGYVAQSTGDGIFALFGAPVAHEDHPQRALYAALRMQEDLKRYSDRIRTEGRVPMQARVGVNTGEVVVRSITTGEGRTEYVPVGHSTGIAARMQALAPIGSIAATEQIRKLCEGYFVFKALGPIKVKGVSEPVNVYEVTGLGPLRTRLQRGAARGYSKFVGREREMETLRHAAEQAKAGHGQVVGAVAEPGVGKSRLFLEFKAKNQSGWMVLEAFSVSHGKASAYLPVLDLLQSYFDIQSEDDARKRREKVAGKITALDRSLEDALPYLFALLGIVEGEDPLAQMDGQVKKRRTLEAIKRILLRESLTQPLIVMCEDLHWIDEQTQEFLNLLADSLANARILLLVNYRPEYSHQWGSKTYYTQLRLDPLGTESADEMLSALLGDSLELAPLKKLIIERTEGNPFFMEETYQSMLQEGVIARNGAVRLVKPLQYARIPTTVQGVLAARIDRLPADAKQLLQTLSVLGREFPMSLIRAVFIRSHDELNRMLKDLQLGEFIYEQPALGDTEFTFKHALTREVAYNSVLMERRKLLHERAGEAIEELNADALDDHVVALANHFRQAGSALKASDYLRRAGVVCIRRAAFPEAATHLSLGLELIQALPESAEQARREWELLGPLAVCLTVTAGAGSAQRGDLLMRMKLHCEQSNDDRRMIEVVMNRIYFHSVRNELAMECELSKEAVKIAERLGDRAWLDLALSSLGYSLLKRGEFFAARTQLERGIAASVDGPHFINEATHSGMLIKAYLSWTQWTLGFPNQAARTIAEAVLLVRKKGSPAPIAFALIYAAELHRLAREPDKTVSFSGEAMEIAKQSGFALLEAQASFEHGWGLAQGAQVAEGLEEVLGAMKELEATGAVASAWRAGPIAECWARSDRPEKGVRLLQDAVAQATATGEHFYEAELQRLLGELTLASNSSKEDDAKSNFRAARELAQRQGGRSLELRATMSLGRLLEREGKRGEATDLVSSIYDSFTEGFETPDLREARDLLGRLRV
jgi:predicted ATPase/class 3 adenylate cyclase